MIDFKRIFPGEHQSHVPRLGSFATKRGELLVMLALVDFANDADESWPSIPILAEKSAAFGAQPSVF